LPSVLYNSQTNPTQVDEALQIELSFLSRQKQWSQDSASSFWHQGAW